VPRVFGLPRVCGFEGKARQHYPHDVIAGAAIGILSSYIFTRPFHVWTVQADVGEKYYGIRLGRDW